MDRLAPGMLTARDHRLRAVQGAVLHRRGPAGDLAVVLAGMGLMQPEFPFNARGQRGVIAFSFVLIIVAILAAVLTD